MLPGATEFVTAGRFRLSAGSAGDPVGAFVYGRRYRERADAVELDPVELRLAGHVYETGRTGGFFGAIRDAMPDSWGRRVIEPQVGLDKLQSAADAVVAGVPELFGRMCFNAAVSNLDEHPRNHAIIAPDRAWRLSPAFDLTPSPVVAQDLARTQTGQKALEVLIERVADTGHLGHQLGHPGRIQVRGVRVAEQMAESS